ncbi:MAG: glycosyltransferase [Sphingomonas sp.]|nr:MAG: glycosyltransferase [Sphingomonas sp.]
MTALSIVIPCYNEEACIDELHRRVTAAAKAQVAEDYELILVNDGSKDGTWAAMQRLAATDPRLVAVNLARNHGHQLALTAGLDLSRGDHILIIDADLQDPPELLSEMMAKMKAENADVVYGLRVSRAGETMGKKLSAAAFYRTLDRLTDIEIPVDTGDFRLMSRRALDALLSLPEQARFIRGMVAWIGFKQLPFPYHRAERLAGETHYPLSKMIKLAFDAVTGFSTAPLRLATQLGMILAGLALLFGLYIFIVWFRGGTVAGWASLALLVVILGAAQMFVLGLIGEYLGRVYIEAKGRPLYIIQDVIGEARSGARLGYRGDEKA